MAAVFSVAVPVRTSPSIGTLCFGALRNRASSAEYLSRSSRPANSSVSNRESRSPSNFSSRLQLLIRLAMVRSSRPRTVSSQVSNLLHRRSFIVVPSDSLRAAVEATLRSDLSRPFPRPASGRIAVKVINHLGDEVMKVFRV